MSIEEELQAETETTESSEESQTEEMPTDGSTDEPTAQAESPTEDVPQDHDSYRMDRANPTHVVILAIVGIYLAYMGYQMIQNTRTGASSMGMGQTVILAIVMWLVAAAILGYAGYVYYWVRRKKERDGQNGTEA